MSDVTAVILSIDEDFTARAIDSVRRQTLQPVETTVVRGVTPFHRALNAGAERVRSEYFIQVDADMVLDPTCIEDLRNCMTNELGLVVGHLRDPLMGRIVGIKLFRTRCVQENRLPDSVSPETDFANAMLRQGWGRVYALKYIGDEPGGWHIFGEHRPDYNAHYTFSKYAREGAKYRHRKAGGGLRAAFRQLQSSRHDLAMLAVVAMAHGIFANDEQDPHLPFTGNDESAFLERFLVGASVSRGLPRDLPGLLQNTGQESFRAAYQLGSRLRRNGAASDFLCYARQLGMDESVEAWVALVGMCHGLFLDEYTDAYADSEFATLCELLPAKRVETKDR